MEKTKDFAQHNKEGPAVPLNLSCTVKLPVSYSAQYSSKNQDSNACTLSEAKNWVYALFSRGNRRLTIVSMSETKDDNTFGDLNEEGQLFWIMKQETIFTSRE